jgi:Family of unknown function (DUF5709)
MRNTVPDVPTRRVQPNRATGSEDRVTEDEDQPESPLLGQMVQEDTAETLESDDLGSDALDAGYVPPDRPSAETREEWSDEAGNQSLDTRLSQEEPESGQVSDQDRAGRLVEDGDRDGFGEDVGIDGGAASAEEAAVHERDGY